MRNSMMDSANDASVREGNDEGNSDSEIQDCRGKEWGDSWLARQIE